MNNQEIIDRHLERIEEFSRRWMITEFALFGSILRDDFGPDSDIDVLITFSPEARWSLFDLAEMQQELKVLFGREVDIVTRQGLESSINPIRREAILSNAVVIYET
jgi:hypothetical protein